LGDVTESCEVCGRRWSNVHAKNSLRRHRRTAHPTPQQTDARAAAQAAKAESADRKKALMDQMLAPCLAAVPHTLETCPVSATFASTATSLENYLLREEVAALGHPEAFETWDE
jgi:hypothetical protein